ncbi:MAG: C1 family peptidase [Isosphaeraceae bacterium]
MCRLARPRIGVRILPAGSGPRPGRGGGTPAAGPSPADLRPPTRQPRPGNLPRPRPLQKQYPALTRALEASTPPAVRSIIANLNERGRGRAGYTGFARRHLELEIGQRRLPGLRALPPLTSERSASQITEQLTPEHVGEIASSTIRSLTGTRPPADLKARIQKQNAEAPRALGARAVVQGARTPTPQLPKFDWRDKGWIVRHSGIVTAAKDQSRPGNCGCCWAFASIGTVEAAYARSNLVLIGGSEQYLLNCTAPLLAAAGTTGVPYSCDGGWWAFDVLTTKVTPRGVPTAAALNYVAVQGPPNTNFPLPYKLERWGYVSTGQNPNEIPTAEELKQALCEFGPLAAAVNVFDPNAWYLYNGDGSIQDFPDDPQRSVNHAIMIVGWDDTRDNGQGAWVIKNSWGEDWGQQGFGFVRYGHNNIGFGAAWVVPSGLAAQGD